jgi:3-oxoacyl-[acyl-carrier-protein] synthase II
MPASILGLGIVSAAGNGVGELREALDGRREPQTETVVIQTPHGPAEQTAYVATPDGLDHYVPKRSLRRIDRFARMALLASYLARDDAGIEWTEPQRVGIVFGSGYGPLAATFAFQDSLIDDGDACASPTHFANSVHNALASQVAISMGVRGPCQTLTAFDETAAAVIDTAQGWLESGAVDYVLAGMGDEVCPASRYAYAALAKPPDTSGTPAPPCPHDSKACSATPGEGFVVFLLSATGSNVPATAYGCIKTMTSANAATAVAPFDATAVFTTMEGERDTVPPAAHAETHASLYGTLPTALGFEAAIAAVAVADGKQQRVTCLGHGSNAVAHLVHVGIPESQP